jgi:hypothetical protein
VAAAGCAGGGVTLDDDEPEPEPAAEPEPVPLADGDGEPLGTAGATAELVYVLPSGETVSQVSISSAEVPVPLSPEKQTMTSSEGRPPGMPKTVAMVAMGSSSVPLNGAFTLLVNPEMLWVFPLGSTIRKTAEPWNPAGHATVVAQVGLRLVAPLAGFSATSPGSAPTWAWATPAPSTKPPTVAPATASRSAVRPALGGDVLRSGGRDPEPLLGNEIIGGRSHEVRQQAGHLVGDGQADKAHDRNRDDPGLPAAPPAPSPG